MRVHLLATLFALLLSFAKGAAVAPGVVLPVPDTTAAGSLLWIPNACLVRSCPLVVVSHSRGGSPRDGLDAAGHGLYHGFLASVATAGFALLLSSDGGPRTWGSPQALAAAGAAWRAAKPLFRHSGTTFAMGFSMGALTSTLVRLRGTIPVRATVLIAPRLSLAEAVERGGDARLAEIMAAYGVLTVDDLLEQTLEHDPVGFLPSFRMPPGPVMVVGSRADGVVPLVSNGLAYFQAARVARPDSVLVEVPGGHLGAGHLSAAVAAAVVRFLRAHDPRRHRPKSRRLSGEPLTSIETTRGTPSVRK